MASPAPQAISESNHLLDPSASSDAVIAFFKQAFADRIDVPEFLASSKVLHRVPLPPNLPNRGDSRGSEVFYQAGRIGSEFFLKVVQDTNSTPLATPTFDVVGRKGNQSFHLNENTLTTSAVTNDNPLVSISESSFRVVCQFLGMGEGGVKPGSATWNGNTVTGDNWMGRFWGVLQLSNNLPYRIALSTGPNEPPYKEFTYQYPEPSAALGGYPASITLYYNNSKTKEPVPYLESRLFAVKGLSGSSAADSIPDIQAFVSADIAYTNVFLSNGLYGKQTNGALLPILSVGAPLTHVR